MPDLHVRNNALRGCKVAVALLLFISACTPTKPVYIPREWRETPAHTPPTVSSGTGAQGRPSRSQTEGPRAPGQQQASPSSQQFVLSRPPEIKETEVRPSHEPGPAPAQKGPAHPQHMASMHLVNQANAQLAQGGTDAAISLFEQAVQLDVYNGSAYFGLARAWRMKGSSQKSIEFARKAEILFQDDRSRLEELYLFEASMFREMGDKAREEEYRARASRLSAGAETRAVNPR